MTIRFVCPGLTTIEPIDVARDAGLNKETGSQDLPAKTQVKFPMGKKKHPTN